jgi:flagellum-specific peptidoglycan hydrolase FlgJ
MYNYNFAGIKGKGPEGYTAKLHTREGWGATEQRIQDGFRAYTNADSGAKDYVSLLIRKFGSALEAAEAEDPTGFAQKLKSAGYYTGNEQAYASAVTRLANKAMGLGFDAVGSTGGDWDNASIEPYFELQSASSAGLASLAPGLLPNAELTNDGSQVTRSHLPTTAAFSDEISRAALRIAAQYGA